MYSLLLFLAACGATAESRGDAGRAGVQGFGDLRRPRGRAVSGHRVPRRAESAAGGRSQGETPRGSQIRPAATRPEQRDGDGHRLGAEGRRRAVAATVLERRRQAARRPAQAVGQESGTAGDHHRRVEARAGSGRADAAVPPLGQGRRPALRRPRLCPGPVEAGRQGLRRAVDRRQRRRPARHRGPRPPLDRSRRRRAFRPVDGAISAGQSRSPTKATSSWSVPTRWPRPWWSTSGTSARASCG